MEPVMDPEAWITHLMPGIADQGSDVFLLPAHVSSR